MVYYYSPVVARRRTMDISNGVTVVDCQKQVRSWRLIRSLIQALIPCCNGTSFIDDEERHVDQYRHFRSVPKQKPYLLYPQPNTTTTTSTTASCNCSIVTGTIFGSRKGKVNLCIQTTNSLLLLELAVSTQTLARDMRGGFLRIALESYDDDDFGYGDRDEEMDFFSTTVWKMYCNGRAVGFAVKRRPTEAQSRALRLMGSGAGVVPGKDRENDEVMYLRAKFERVCGGSGDSESFHLIDPDRCIGQELSIFFYRL